MKAFTRCLLLIFLLSLVATSMLLLSALSQEQSLLRLLSGGGAALSGDLIQDEEIIARNPEYDEMSSKEGFIVHTSKCRIPDVDPWHSSTLPYVKRNVSSLHCRRVVSKPDLTFTKGDFLVVNESSIPYYGSLDFCEYVEVIRPEKGDSIFDLGRKRYVFRDRIVMKKEFVKVYCYSKNNSLIYQNLHALTPTSPLMKHMKESLYLRHKRRGYLEHLNVMMVGIDSTSRINFHRQFPKTLSILKNRLSAYEMFGYNKVRDNTFINLVPMFLGKYVEESGWSDTSAEGFDKHDYAWKRFASAGYHTLFAEDAPRISIWNFEKPGFTRSPADYYFRPFSLALAAAKKMWHNNFHCFGDRLETDITLDYVQRFIRTRQGSPFFAFTFLTRPTYDSINQNTDESHSRFLNALLNDGLLKNSLVIYFSDHGVRRGDILSTYIGKLEERLPAMFVALPVWFRRKYPQIARNLEINQHRLTTPFDVNALLNNLLRFNGEPKLDVSPDTRSISWFDKVPEGRSCRSATVDDHWCTCLQLSAVSTDSDEIKAAAEILLSGINDLTKELRSKCARYKLVRILDALQSSPTEKLLTFKQSVNNAIGRKAYYGDEALGRIVMYHVTIRVTPGGGIYQGTVRYEAVDDTYHLSGDISRTNNYGDTSFCVKDHQMKKYCYCY